MADQWGLDMAKSDQVAWYARDDEAAENLKKVLGLDKELWIGDRVTGKSLFPDGTWSVNVGELRFCYSQGIELEILTYVEGNHWHMSNPQWMLTATRFFISHVGIHLDDGEEFPDTPNLVQETFTISHTSEYLTTGAGAGRKYHYRIHQLAPGSYVKYIRRIRGPNEFIRPKEWNVGGTITAIGAGGLGGGTNIDLGSGN